MVLKRLDELSISELRTEFVKAGIQGGFQENQAIVRLTIHLVSIKEDPFTFQFNSDLSGDASVQSNPDDFKVVSEAPEDMLELVVLPVPELPDAVLARASLKPLRSSTVEVDAEFSEFGDEALDYVELEDEVLETIISSPHGIVSSTFAGLATIRSVSACSDTPPSLKMSFFMNYF